MQRDFQFLVRLLSSVQTAQQPVVDFHNYRNMPADQHAKLQHHVDILLDLRLLKKEKVGKSEKFRITNAGHDFLSQVSSQYVMGKIQEEINENGDLDMSAIKKLAEKYRHQELGL